MAKYCPVLQKFKNSTLLNQYFLTNLFMCTQALVRRNLEADLLWSLILNQDGEGTLIVFSPYLFLFSFKFYS